MVVAKLIQNQKDPNSIAVVTSVTSLSFLFCTSLRSACSRRLSLFHLCMHAKAADELHVPFLGRISIDPRIVVAEDSGKPFILEHKGSEAEKSFGLIVKKIEQTIRANANKGKNRKK